jgi:hypothetical protein
MLGGMKFLIAIGLVAAMMQGKIQPQQSSIPITSSDPFTREMEDKLGKILEIQNEKEMTNGPAKTVDRHENAMLIEMVKQLEKLTRAVGQASTPSADDKSRKAAYKEMESQSGKLVSGLRYFVPVINDEQTKPEQPQPIEANGLRSAFEQLAPQLARVIQSIRTGVIHLNETRSAISQLRAFQQTGKTRSR